MNTVIVFFYSKEYGVCNDDFKNWSWRRTGCFLLWHHHKKTQLQQLTTLFSSKLSFVIQGFYQYLKRGTRLSAYYKGIWRDIASRSPDLIYRLRFEIGDRYWGVIESGLETGMVFQEKKGMILYLCGDKGWFLLLLFGVIYETNKHKKKRNCQECHAIREIPCWITYEIFIEHIITAICLLPFLYFLLSSATFVS